MLRAEFEYSGSARKVNRDQEFFKGYVFLRTLPFADHGSIFGWRLARLVRPQDWAFDPITATPC